MSCREGAFLLLSLTLFWSVEFMQIPLGNALIPEQESALETLRERLNLSRWTGDPCSSVNWIRCAGNVVSELNLQQRSLLGTIPAELEAFRNITSLRLDQNNLTGGIPSSIFNLSSLLYLNLSYNPLGGPLPDITGSKSLNKIDLTQTQVTGNIPASFGSLDNLGNLVTLNVGNNPQLNGSVSFLDQPYNLKSFNGSGCGFSGNLPYFENSAGLELVDLQMNDFSGTIPNALFQKQSLGTLYLNNNPKLSGNLPDTSSLQNLAEFVISDCALSGPLEDRVFADSPLLEVIGFGNNRFTSFPSDLQALSNLRELDVHSNNITGPLPKLPAAANQTANGGLTLLTFSNNHFNGEIPSSWYEATNLQGMFLAQNNLTGGIHDKIGALTQLRHLNLSGNGFSGQLPEQLGALINLETIDLRSNRFSGNVPGGIATLPKLKQVVLDDNNFTGIPQSLVERKDIALSYSNNPGLRTFTTPKNGGSTGAIVGAIIGACAIVGVVAAVIALYIKKRRKKGPDEISLADMPQSVHGFTRKQLKALTENYKTRIGKGGFGSVYYGKLADGKEVAVKVRKSDSKQGSDEFLNEVRLLSRLHHRNLVSLVGYCLEANQQMLVYDYMSQGTLHDHLYHKGSADSSSQKTLPWKTRLNIAVQAAKGLEYLHRDCNPPIIHRDVKSSNILLTSRLQAKVGDLGISKQASEKDSDQGFSKSGVSTVIKGTFGYLDPEYFIRRRLTTKSDVYSFGVVLLEIITAKRPQTETFPDSTAGNLIEWVRIAENSNQIERVVDPELQGEYEQEVMLKVARLALSCTRFSGPERPEMGEVVRSLTQALCMEGDYVDSSGISSALSSGISSIPEIVPLTREEELPFGSGVFSSSSFSSKGFSYPSTETTVTTPSLTTVTPPSLTQ
ncbi:hypothetical protein R1sor_011665 [Riccia sorocarpa]|uniref:Protein kinase domain-containing protein n=1 Tax=Riccia sorocarpa TaxID=122646 RepID=A0ABD3I4Z5_9MARC